MNYSNELFNELQIAVNYSDYRHLQRSLKALRSVGYPVLVKLNTKKVVLLEMASILLSAYRQYQEEKCQEQQQAAQPAQAVDNTRFNQMFDAYKRNFINMWNDADRKGEDGYEVCKRKFRTLARKHHPDMGGNAEQFKALSQAWERVQVIFAPYPVAA